MATPVKIPADRFETPQDDAESFLGTLRPQDLAYFLCNVGDGDAQVVLLPENPQTSKRQALVVDAGRRSKVPALIKSLAAEGLLPANGGALERGAIALVVATHPHLDHVAGIPEVLRTFREAIAEFWDPGYFHTLPAYHEMMTAIEESPSLLYAQPTSGLRRWIGNVQLTVLSPSIGLRNRFDSYGVEINDSSISLRLEFPAARVIELDDERNLVTQRRTQSLILGADAQTLSWSYALTDFPYLHASHSAVAKALKMATGSDPLRANVMKISHHCSKHGVNLELIERIGPSVTLVSSVGGAGAYRFPHSVAQEVIREGLERTTSTGKPHKPDFELGLFYTSDVDTGGDPLGTIAMVMGSQRWEMWRFGDEAGDPVDLAAGRRWKK